MGHESPERLGDTGLGQPLRVAVVASMPIRGKASSLSHVTNRLACTIGGRHRATVLLAPITYQSVVAGAIATAAFNSSVRSWREAALFSPQVVLPQSRRAAGLLRGMRPLPDVAIQVGGMFSAAADPRMETPLCVRVDCSFHPEVVYEAPWRPRRYRELFFRLQHALYRNCNCVFTVSEWARAQVLEWHGLPDDRVVTVGTGINTELPSQPPPMPDHAPTLLFVGTGFWVKGVDFVLQAFPSIRDRVPEAVLHIVGQPKDMRLPSVLPEGVRFHGPIYDRSRLDALFQEATALVLPSRVERLGHVVLESFASARPVVASRTCAVPEWVRDGETGFTVTVGDVQALAERCVQLLSDRALAERMGRRGYERVCREGTWDAVVAKMEPHLQRAAAEGPVRP